jgi:hypothetical protein
MLWDGCLSRFNAVVNKTTRRRPVQIYYAERNRLLRGFRRWSISTFHNNIEFRAQFIFLPYKMTVVSRSRRKKKMDLFCLSSSFDTFLEKFEICQKDENQSSWWILFLEGRGSPFTFIWHRWSRIDILQWSFRGMVPIKPVSLKQVDLLTLSYYPLRVKCEMIFRSALTPPTF